MKSEQRVVREPDQASEKNRGGGAYMLRAAALYSVDKTEQETNPADPRAFAPPFGPSHT
jgi:hypothetical protein